MPGLFSAPPSAPVIQAPPPPSAPPVMPIPDPKAQTQAAERVAAGAAADKTTRANTIIGASDTLGG